MKSTIGLSSRGRHQEHFNMEKRNCQACKLMELELKRSQSEANALRTAYAELRDRYNNEKVKTGRYDHCIF